MFARQLVYLSLPGYYPRLLADDGIGESLVLPATDEEIPVEFVCYNELGQQITITEFTYCNCHNPNGAVLSLDIQADAIVFTNSVLSGAIITAQIKSLGENYYIYPFRVLRANPQTL